MEGPELIQILTGYDNRLAEMESRIAALEFREERGRVVHREAREDWHRLAQYWRELTSRIARLERER